VPAFSAAFDFDPIHRYMTPSDFRIVWNVLLNGNDLPATISHSFRSLDGRPRSGASGGAGESVGSIAAVLNRPLECWVRRFLAYLAERQGLPHPRVESGGVRDYLTQLAVRRGVSASTQNQAFCAILFLCRVVLGIDVEGVSNVARAKRGSRLPVVLSVPETAALLGAMSGNTWLMAALIYGGGLRVSECCELRIKDPDFDQGLVFVRGGKGAKDRATLLAETARDELRAQLRRSEALHRADRQAGVAGVALPNAVERKYANAGCELGWFWVFPSHSLSTDPSAGIVRRHRVHESVIRFRRRSRPRP
jgi:integrase